MKKISAIVIAAALGGAPIVASAATAQADASRTPVTKPLVLGDSSSVSYSVPVARPKGRLPGPPRPQAQLKKPKCTETRTTDCAVQTSNGNWVWVSVAGLVTGLTVALVTSDSP